MTSPFRSDFSTDQRVAPFTQSNSKGYPERAEVAGGKRINREEDTWGGFSNPRKKTGRARQLELVTRERLATALSCYCKLSAPDYVPL
jgi:hypothetical protein